MDATKLNGVNIRFVFNFLTCRWPTT